jgi:hypothetical protein
MVTSSQIKSFGGFLVWRWGLHRPLAILSRWLSNLPAYRTLRNDAAQVASAADVGRHSRQLDRVNHNLRKKTQNQHLIL